AGGERELAARGAWPGTRHEPAPPVHQLPTARGPAAAPPLLLVARPAPVAVATTDVHQVAVGLLRGDLPGLQQRRMETVIEAHLDDPARRPRGISHRHEVLEAMRPRLLHEHVAAGIERR